MTLNAMFRFPELYAAGIAIASPSDQLLYNSIYQERYMGLPAENAAVWSLVKTLHCALVRFVS